MGVSQLQNPVQLAFRGPGSLVVQGPATGLTYTFQGRMPQQVDGRDAKLLMKAGQFLRR
jgi:hypothetical protein